jgi:hypothetical protein
MDIIIGKYKLVPSVGSSDRWDLIEQVERTGKTSGEKYEAEKALAYSVNLEYALQNIIAMKLAEIAGNVTLAEYVTQYIKEKKEIIDIIRKITNF